MKKKAILTVILVLVLLLLTGCGKPETPEEILAAYQEAAKDLTCTQMDMTMDLGMSMDLPAAGSWHTVYLDMKLDAATMTNREPYASQVDMTIDMHYYSPEVHMDQQTKLDSQVYSVMEEDQLVSYTKTMGMWVRAETGMNPEEVLKGADSMIEMANLTFRRDETVTQWEGKPAVCLTTTITGDAVQSLLDAATQSITDQGDAIDFSALSGPTRLYISTETWLPLAQEVTIEGMGEVLGDMGDAYMEIDFNTCTATIEYRSFAPQPPIELPQEARDHALRWERLLEGNSNNGDGTYTIREGSAIVDVAIPEGLQEAGNNYDTVSFARENRTQFVVYKMYAVENDPEMSGAYFVEQMESLCAAVKENGMEFQRETTQIPVGTLKFTCDSVTVQLGGASEQRFVIWAPVKQENGTSYYVTVQIHDGEEKAAEKDAIATMEQIASYVKAVTPSSLMN